MPLGWMEGRANGSRIGLWALSLNIFYSDTLPGGPPPVRCVCRVFSFDLGTKNQRTEPKRFVIRTVESQNVLTVPSKVCTLFGTQKLIKAEIG